MDSIIGNNKQKEEIKNIIKKQTIGHAYMFVGIDGIGKSMIAKEFAKAILCENPSETYCDQCESCKVFNNSPDYVYVTDTDDVIKVGEIRALSENIMLKPIKSARRVFIINNADKMNESAQNALLKILEEPPEYATIILVVSNKEKIVKTIQSRCNEIYFSPLTLDEMKTYCKMKNEGEELLLYARGSIGKLEKLKNSNYVKNVLELENALNLQDLIEMNRALTKVKENKEVKENIQEILQLLMIKLNSELEQDYSKKIAQIEVLEECCEKLKRNANFDITLDYMMIQLLV